MIILIIIIIIAILYFIGKSGKGKNVAEGATSMVKETARFAASTVGATVIGAKNVIQEASHSFKGGTDLAGLLREIAVSGGAIRVLYKDGILAHITYASDNYMLDGMPVPKESLLRCESKIEYFAKIS